MFTCKLGRGARRAEEGLARETWAHHPNGLAMNSLSLREWVKGASIGTMDR